MTRIAMLAVAALASLALAGVVGAAGSETYALSARLTAGQEVPKQVVKAPAARGMFVATLAEGTRTLRWKLTFGRLTGAATAAHVHFGRKGKAGAPAAALCGPCRSGQRGKLKLTPKAMRAVLAGATYVNVHTPKNPAGEVRGQVKRQG